MIKARWNPPADGKTTEELVPQALALGDSRETTVLYLFSVELERVFGEFKALLNEGSEFTDAAALLAKDFLCVSGTDDDLCWIEELSNLAEAREE